MVKKDEALKMENKESLRRHREEDKEMKTKNGKLIIKRKWI